jgi:hypothetical protein
VAESGLCPTCSSPALRGQAFCATCGAALSDGAARSGSAGPGAAAAASGQGAARAKGRGAGSPAGKKRAASSGGSAAKIASPGAADVKPAASGDNATIGEPVDPRLAALGLADTTQPGPESMAPAPIQSESAHGGLGPAERPFAAPPPSLDPIAARPLAEPSAGQVPAARPYASPSRNPFAPAAPHQFGPPASAQFAAPVPPAPVSSAAYEQARPQSEPRLEPEPEADAEPERAPSGRIPGSYVPPAENLHDSSWILRPSSASSARQSGSSLSVSVGAIPVSTLGAGPAAAEVAPAPVIAARPAVPAVVPPGPLAAPTPFPASPSFSAPVEAADPSSVPFATSSPHQTVSPKSPTASVQGPGKSARKESTQVLVAFGLVTAGAVIGMASLFLPWANDVGIGIGNYSKGSPPPNQWGWGMPTAWPLFLLSVLILGAASGNDRAQERLPRLAPVIVKVTDLIMPMILGGLYLGVCLLYVTLSTGYGLGILALLVGAGLLIGGAVVTLFFPPEVATEND